MLFFLQNRLFFAEDVVEDEDDDIYEPVEINSSMDNFCAFRRLPSPTDFPSATTSGSDATKRTTRYVAVQSLPIMPDDQVIQDAINKLKLIDAKAADSLADGLDESDVLFREKPFKSFSRNSQRGSSKVVCSLISVSSVFCCLFAVDL